MGELGWSVGLGIGLGLCYAGASVLNVQLAERARSFVVVVIGGMVVRMTVTLALVALIAALVPVVIAAFIGAFLCVFIAGMVGEIAWLHKRALPC